MKLTAMAFIMSLVTSNFASAETISCTGYTDSSQKTQVVLTILPQKQKGDIRFIGPSGSVTQGLKLTNVSYPAPNKLRYSDFLGGSHLDCLIVNGEVKKNAFTHGLYFADTELDCTINGKIPSPPSCGSNPSETLITVLREGRFNQTLQAVNYQLACGADVNYKDKYGCTPLLYAIDGYCGGNRTPAPHSITGLPQIVDGLINAGAFVDIVDPAKKETALLKATRLEVRDVYDSFIAAEANFDFQDSQGMTPLMWAASYGDDWSVKDILQARPDRRLKNKKGQTAFDIAKQWQKERVIDLVRIPDVTIDVVGQTDGSCSPLSIEAKEGQTIEIMLAATDKMFKFELGELGLDIMADRNSKNSQIVKLETAGKYRFTCGFHGSSSFSTGQLIVK